MKKKIKKIQVVLFILCIGLLAATLSGCAEVTVRVENMLTLNKAFGGERTITCNLGKEFGDSAEKKALLMGMIEEKCPDVLVYEDLTDDSGYKVRFNMSFASLSEYKKKIASILGRPVSVMLETPNSALAKGWSLQEDFDGMELLEWLKEEIAIKGYKDINLTFEGVSNVVDFEGDIVSSKTSQLEIREITGYAVNGVFIETTNNKDGSYDRRLTLSVPQSTYAAMGNKLNTIMVARTDPDLAAFSDWLQQGNYQEYQVLYKGIRIKDLQRVTNLFMDCKNADIYYGDENQSSTPLAEQLVFEENINTMTFVPQEDRELIFQYKYSLPIKTTYGQGVVFSKGTWEKQGEWIDGVYTLQSEKTVPERKVYDIRIPDGMQYSITGIDVELITYDNDSFERSFDLIYNRLNGEEGLEYAFNFLSQNGLQVTKEKDERGLVCHIVQNGTAKEISNQLGDLFGGGNFISYTKQTSAMAVVTDITVVDNINIAYMLTGDNVEVPFNYTVLSAGNEDINMVTGENKAVKESPKLIENKDNSRTVKLVGGENMVTYVATIPYVEGVVTYCIIALVMVLLAGALIVLFFKKTQKLNEADKRKLFLEEQAESRAERNINDEDYFDHF